MGVSWPEKSIKSVEECAELCEMNVRCDGFHYYGFSDDHFGDCYLKTNVKSVSKDLGDGRERYGGICRKGISISRSIGFEKIQNFKNENIRYRTIDRVSFLFACTVHYKRLGV